MLSIGEFARFAGVSVRMLRHYDSLGLLSPSYVDASSGYRFYDPALLTRADALVAFKELGFSLEQVGALLDEGGGPEHLVTLLESTGRVGDVAEIGARIGPMFENLNTDLAAAGLTPSGPSVAWYEPDGDGMRFAAAAPLAEGEFDGAEVAELEEVPRAITAIYRGSMAGIGTAWQELSRHVAESEFEFTGPCREVYLDLPLDDPDVWVTELQQPVI